MKSILVAAALGLAVSLAIAQPGQGPGPGKGPGDGPGMGKGMGPGSGPGKAGKGQRYSFGPSNTRGWSMMSPQERTEHRTKMMGFKSYDECVAYTAEHHKLMEARAKERGRPVPATPRQNMCERMKQAGRLS